MGLWQGFNRLDEPTVDWVAEALDYTVGAGAIDEFGVTTRRSHCGDYLVDDIKDVVGFARKGYDVYR